MEEWRNGGMEEWRNGGMEAAVTRCAALSPPWRLATDTGDLLTLATSRTLPTNRECRCLPHKHAPPNQSPSVTSVR